MTNVVVVEETISAAEFIEFRKLMGSPDVDSETARKTVSGALYTVCLREDGRLLGFARVVGDGVLYFYISDVIVHPVLRGGGYGVRLMNSVVEYLKRSARAAPWLLLFRLLVAKVFTSALGSDGVPMDASALACTCQLSQCESLRPWLMDRPKWRDEMVVPIGSGAEHQRRQRRQRLLAAAALPSATDLP